MARGAQRDRDRERANARNSKSAPKKCSGAKVGGVNADADALKAKIAAKKEAIAKGEYSQVNGSSTGKKGSKAKNLVNPHSGKRDPNYTKKVLTAQKQCQAEALRFSISLDGGYEESCRDFCLV